MRLDNIAYAPGLVIAILLVSITSSNAASYFVSTTGSDDNSGSAGDEWGSISYGISQLGSGDTLIVRDGLYIGEDHYVSGIPSGSAGNFTTVKAENPFRVRIENDSTLNSSTELFEIDGSYIHVDGFILNHKDSSNPTYSASMGGGVYNKLTRVIIRREGVQTDFGGWLAVRGSYQLVEDVAGVGTARYGYNTGGVSSDASYNIFRRVVGRLDYQQTPQPKSTFVHYGNNTSSNPQSTHMFFQNCIALDSNQPDYDGGSSGYKTGGIKANKSASNDIIVGSIVLNEDLERYAIYMAGKDNRIENSVIWDNNLGNYGSNAPVAYKFDAGFLGSPHGSTAEYLTTGQNGDPEEDNTGIADQTFLLAPDDYPNNAENKAVVLKRIGRTGTFYGDEGWDEVTDEDLWPWLYEDEIKAVFAEDNPAPSGYTPINNVAARGFAAHGNGLYGGEITLTSYIWEYLGNPCPGDLCTKDPVIPTSSGGGGGGAGDTNKSSSSSSSLSLSPSLVGLLATLFAWRAAMRRKRSKYFLDSD